MNHARKPPLRLLRARLIALLVGLVALPLVASGCGEYPDQPGLELVWGRSGTSPGRFEKPRAIAIEPVDGPFKDRLYIIDMTARIQVFDTAGNYLSEWQTPVHVNGRPTGMNFDRAGNLLVADTHYYRLLIYSPDGKLLQTIGGVGGHEPGQFGFVTNVVQDAAGNYYIGEYGEYDRIQKFTRDGKFITQWGSHGNELGQFSRPQSLDIDAQGHIWVADAGNHRVQVFDGDGKLLFHWGHEGSQPGELEYPYSLKLDGKGAVYICEFGNSRVQKFSLDGQSLGVWVRCGRGPGELFNPWCIALDSSGRIHIVDSNNHRVQRFRL